MIIALFAVDQQGGMGFDGRMPWPRNKEDMRWFKKMTDNQLVVMGRKTWNSSDMPTPLPNRVNILITNNFIDRDDIIQIRGDIPTGLMEMQDKYPDDNIFVIGGPDILMQSIPVLEYAFITRIPGEYISDVSIDLTKFLETFKLIETKKLETCEIEKYEAIPQRKT
jgi:dihydrofolate reductase